MKRTLIGKIGAIACLGLWTLAGSLANAAPYGTAGCGIGALAFGDKPGKIQILSATLNNIISPQTSAITSGTSNCYEDSHMASAMFITVNEQALKKDISRGGGESVAGLSQILNCADSSLLGAALQKNYGEIFTSDSASPEQINQNIRSTIRLDASLAQSCSATI